MDGMGIHVIHRKKPIKPGRLFKWYLEDPGRLYITYYISGGLTSCFVNVYPHLRKWFTTIALICFNCVATTHQLDNVKMWFHLFFEGGVWNFFYFTYYLLRSLLFPHHDVQPKNYFNIAKDIISNNLYKRIPPQKKTALGDYKGTLMNNLFSLPIGSIWVVVLFTYIYIVVFVL